MDRIKQSNTKINTFFINTPKGTDIQKEQSNTITSETESNRKDIMSHKKQKVIQNYFQMQERNLNI